MSAESPVELVLVEDNEDDVEMSLRALRRAGLDRGVRVLRDGREALAWLEALDARGLPRVVFLDLRLPGVGGLTVLRHVRAHALAQHVPVVVVSSTRRDEEIAECYRLGANGFVAKEYGESPPGEYLARAARYWLRSNRVPR